MVVGASDNMQSLEDIPLWFADFIGVNLAVAQIILSIVVILSVLLPVMILARGSRGITTEAVMLFLTLCLLVGIGWLPFWILITCIALLAMTVAFFGTSVVTGE